MMRKLISVTFCFSLILWGSASAQNPGAEPSETGLSQIQSRVEAGDQSALEEAKKLPINQAVSLLSIYALDASTNKARAEQAREVLRNFSGLSVYMKQQLLKLRSEPAGEYGMGKAFDLLAVVGGDNAAAAAAPFLFVDDSPVLLSNDSGTSPINYQAIKSLANMHLSDRPVDKEYYDLKAADIEAWKTWAIKKGYIDNSIPRLMTFEEKEVPLRITAQTEAALARAKSESQATPQATAMPPSTPTLATPTLAASTPRPSGTATPTVAAEKPASTGFPVVPLVILAALIALAAVFFLRRKSSLDHMR